MAAAAWRLAILVQNPDGASGEVELDHFCECVLEGKQPLTSGLDGRKAIEAINAVYLSAYLGEKIHLPLEETPDLPHIFVEMKTRSPRFE
jgi:predicted dehydrogenase